MFLAFNAMNFMVFIEPSLRLVVYIHHYLRLYYDGRGCRINGIRVQTSLLLFCYMYCLCSIILIYLLKLRNNIIRSSIIRRDLDSCKNLRNSECTGDFTSFYLLHMSKSMLLFFAFFSYVRKLD